MRCNTVHQTFNYFEVFCIAWGVLDLVNWLLTLFDLMILNAVYNNYKMLYKPCQCFPLGIYVVSLVCLYLEKLLKLCKEGCTAEVGVFKSLLDQGVNPNIHDEVCLLL